MVFPYEKWVDLSMANWQCHNQMVHIIIIELLILIYCANHW